MNAAIDAIYENGTFRPLQPERIAIAEGQRVRITVSDESDPEALRLALQVYGGLNDKQIDEIEEIALDRSRFFGTRDAD